MNVQEEGAPPPPPSGLGKSAKGRLKLKRIRSRVAWDEPDHIERKQTEGEPFCIWVVVKIMVPFWVRSIIRHLLFRVPQEGP